MMIKKLIEAVFFVSTLVGAQVAHASLLECPATTNPTDKVENSGGTLTAVSACQYLSPPDHNDDASTVNVNSAEFFGTNTWEMNGDKVEIAGEALSGTWAISGVNFAAKDYMIVFKNGNGTNLTGFLFNEAFSSGDWTTPFVSGMWALDQSKSVSHFAVFERAGKIGAPDGGEVPEPGTLSLLGLAIAGFVVARHRRSTK